MISVERLRRETGVGTRGEQSLEDYREEVTKLWEDETKLLWSRRVDYEQNIRPRNNRTTVVLLNLMNIETISKVEEREDGDESWEELVEFEDYERSGDRSLKRIFTVWSRHVRVTMTGGYEDDQEIGRAHV